jgi:hypothetical protein
MAVGHRMLAYTAWWQGDFEAVHDHSRRGLACYDANQSRANLIGYSQDSGVVCGYLRAMSDWVLGYPTQAVEGMESTVTHARALGAPPSIAMAILFSAKLAQLRRDPERAHAQAEEALAISTEHGLDAVALWCLLPRGWHSPTEATPPGASPTSATRWTDAERWAWAQCGRGSWRWQRKHTARSGSSTTGCVRWMKRSSGLDATTRT